MAKKTQQCRTCENTVSYTSKHGGGQCKACYYTRGKTPKPPTLCALCGERPISRGSAHGSCATCYRTRRTELAGLATAAQRGGDDLEEAVRKILRAAPKTLEELSPLVQRTPGQVLDLLHLMRDKGQNVHEFSGGKWSLERIPMSLEAERTFEYLSRPDNTFKVGIASDQHLCSRYAREDVLNDLYDVFQREGVDRVINAGNWIDGGMGRVVAVWHCEHIVWSWQDEQVLIEATILEVTLDEQNQFGIAAGFPIVRNRAFGFAYYDGFRNKTGTLQNLAVFL